MMKIYYSNKILILSFLIFKTVKLHLINHLENKIMHNH